MAKRKIYSAEFKVKAVLAVLKGDKTASQLAGELGVHPMVLSEWKKQFLTSAPEVFEKGRSKKQDPEKEKAELFEEIGRLKMELEWLKKNQSSNLAERRQYIESHKKISIARQCELLGIHRSGVYYEPRAVSEKDLELMRLVDEQFTETPFYGTRRLCVALGEQGHMALLRKSRFDTPSLVRHTWWRVVVFFWRISKDGL